MSMLSPVQSNYYEGSPMGKDVKLMWEGFVES